MGTRGQRHRIKVNRELLLPAKVLYDPPPDTPVRIGADQHLRYRSFTTPARMVPEETAKWHGPSWVKT